MTPPWQSALRFLPFLLAASALDASLHVYLYRRLVRPLAPPGARQMGALALVLLGVLMIFGPVSSRGATSPWLSALAQAGYVWMGLAFYLSLCIACADLLLLARRRLRPAAPAERSEPASPSRRALLVRTAHAGAAAAATGVVGYGAFRAFAPPRLAEVAVKLPRMPAALSGLSIVHLSDLHLGVWLQRRFLDEIVSRVNALKPDLVAITGDLVDGSVETLGPVAAALGALRSRFGTYFVTGNHEYYSGAEDWTWALRGMGLKVLRNERAVIGDVGASLDLAGVDDWGASRQGFGRGYDLARALGGRDPDRATVLLAHQPRGFERAAQSGVGLQLSGHTHGGQIWPWTYVVSLAYHPYVAGLHAYADSSIYVSRGCGFWGPPLRVGAPPEIARIALT
jgi:predicted MPP superfamily phosphohydrolase